MSSPRVYLIVAAAQVEERPAAAPEIDDGARIMMVGGSPWPLCLWSGKRAGDAIWYGIRYC